MRPRTLLFATALPAALVLYHGPDRSKAFADASVRAARLAATVAATVVDYKRELPDRHERGARRVLALVEANGGAYIKMGQHLSQMDHLLPLAYTRRLRKTLDATPQSSLADVHAVLREDLGAPVEELFARFDPEPVASASLAQVHAAWLPSGEKVAVKVQHRGLQETSVGDCDWVRLLVSMVDFPLAWLVDEILPNLPRELDFQLEAANCERAGRLLAPLSPGVVVPRVLRATPRVLVMSFEDGCAVDDVDAIRAQGLDPAEVATLVSTAFAEQMLRHGVVHCDPHPANLLVRPQPQGGAQVVLLDHGLYREVGDEFRLLYCELWRALVRGDVPEIERVCRALNTGEQFGLLACMVTARPWEAVTSPDLRALQGREADDDHVRGQAEEYAADIVAMLNRVPPELLLLLKAQDCLRAVDRRLGAPVNTFAITLRVATEVLTEGEPWHRRALARAEVWGRSWGMRLWGDAGGD